jgi:subtilisin family serine protease
MKRFPRVLTAPNKRESVLDESRILVAFRKAVDPKEVHRLIKGLKIAVETAPRQESTKHWVQVNNTGERYWLKTTDGRAITDEEFDRLEKVFESVLDWIGPVYQTASDESAEDYYCAVPNVLLVRKGKTGEREIAWFLEELGLVVDENKSKYLTAFYYFIIPDVKRANAFEVRERLQGQSGEVKFENMPMYKPLATIPNDTFWANQWNMAQINVPNGWDISAGSNTVVICILDEGCDLTHPDLAFAENGINLGTMMPTGAPTGDHGTACGGIAAATFNNSTGVAGVAGNCLLMPVAFQNWTDVECANGINYATTNGAGVISMSFGVYKPGEGNTFGWDTTTIDPEIQNAFNNNVVMCAATGNENRGDHNRYPGRHPFVIGVGGSSTDDNRKTPASPDGECWGANFGQDTYLGVTTGVSVVAPCVQCPTTDRQGTDGYNNNGTLLPNPWACVFYPAPPADGNYIMNFNGTSAATPHVAGFAALLKSQYPALTNVQVRNIIEKSAAKAGTVAYAEQAGFPNGSRNQEMGYGRIDIFRGLDFADVLIKDWSGDSGVEPSTPPGGNFWDFADIVVRITDDNVFDPSNPIRSKNVEKGQQNFIYVRVTNNGPRDARNVTVGCRITPYVGLQFQYPGDWTTTDAMHVEPTPVTNTFASVPAGSSVMAKFTISAAQTDDLYGWVNDHPWHPCLLASVNAGNDYAFASGMFTSDPIVQRKNNLAQRNLSVIDVLAEMLAAVAFPFVAGHELNAERRMQLTIDRKAMPAKAELLLGLDDDGRFFPHVHFDEINQKTEENRSSNADLIYLERTKVETVFGCCRGVLTLEKGSSFKCLKRKKLEPANIKGGELIVKNGKRYIRIKEDTARIQLEKTAGQIYPLSVVINFGTGAEKGGEYTLQVSQQNEQGVTVGGAAAVYVLR